MGDVMAEQAKKIDIKPRILYQVAKAAWEGKYHPNLLANLNSSSAYGNCIMLQVDDTASMVNYSEKVKIKIDSARKEIGLCSLEMHVKKGLYTLNKLQHFRAKMKTETPSEYLEYLGNNLTADKNFSFGLTTTQNLFTRDGDPQHKAFISLLDGLQNRYE
jgi:hypothetical protein